MSHVFFGVFFFHGLIVTVSTSISWEIIIIFFWKEQADSAKVPSPSFSTDPVEISFKTASKSIENVSFVPCTKI